MTHQLSTLTPSRWLAAALSLMDYGHFGNGYSPASACKGHKQSPVAKWPNGPDQERTRGNEHAQCDAHTYGHGQIHTVATLSVVNEPSCSHSCPPPIHPPMPLHASIVIMLLLFSLMLQLLLQWSEKESARKSHSNVSSNTRWVHRKKRIDFNLI